MTLNKSRRFTCLLMLALVTSLALTGCFKGQVEIVVNPDGSGTLGIAFGMTDEAKAILAVETGGQDPMDAFVEETTTSEDFEDAVVERWVEDEYEWVRVTDSFATLDDLHEQIMETEMFQSFSLVQETGIIKNRFVLDATLLPMSDATDESTDGVGGLDPNSIFEMKFIATLPGDLIETNGVRAEDGSINWTVDYTQPTSVHVVSEAWNWLNISIGGVVLLCGFIVVVGVVIGLLITRSGRRDKATEVE